MGRPLSQPAVEISETNILYRFTIAEVRWPQGKISYWGGTKAIVDGIFFEPIIESTTELETSQGHPADTATIVVNNRDYRVTDLDEERALDGGDAIVILSRILRDPHVPESDPWIRVQLFTGILVAAICDRDIAELQIVADLYAAPQVGAVEVTGLQCEWGYKDEDCGYVGPLPDCSFSLEGPNGCTEHGMGHHFGGTVQNDPSAILTNPPPDPGGGTGDTGGGNGGIDDGRGRIYDPYQPDLYVT